MAEFTPLEDINTGVQTAMFRYAKMKVLTSHKAQTSIM